MSTIGNAGPGRPSIGGKLTVVDDKTGIFATAEYPQGRWRDAGPSLSVTKLAENDPVMQKIKDRAGRVNILDMDVYAMTNTKTPSSAYQIYIPVPERLIPKKNGNEFTYLFSYSSEKDTLERLKTEKVSDHLYSAETASIQYIAVIRQPSAGMISICVLPPANRKPAKVKSLKAKNVKKKKVKLTWKKVSGAKGYQVQYSMKKKFPSKKTKKKTTTKRTLTIKKLKKKKIYYFRVRAYKKKASGSKMYGKWSNVVKVKIRK